MTRSTDRHSTDGAGADAHTAAKQPPAPVQGIARGDPAALAEVRDRVSRIIGYKGYGIPQAEQEELVQEVLIQVWQGVNRDGFDPQRGFWGFVHTVAVRRCIDWRRRHRESAIDVLSLVPDRRRGPLRSLLKAERRRAASRVLSQLSPECRELIELRVAENKSYAEVASATGRSEEALRTQMYRCIKKARALTKGLREQ